MTRPGYRRYIVEITTSSRGYYEIEAVSLTAARRLTADAIRQGKVVTFTETATITNLMELKGEPR